VRYFVCENGSEVLKNVIHDITMNQYFMDKNKLLVKISIARLMEMFQNVIGHESFCFMIHSDSDSYSSDSDSDSNDE
jgi:hypothetical protein